MEWAYWLIGGFLALAFGSFLNVAIYRLPLRVLYPDQDLNLLYPPSHCPKCKIALNWRDNIPVISWLLLQGKCRHCQCVIPLRYFYVEIFTAFGTLLLVWLFPVSMRLIAVLILFWALLTLSIIDVDHFLLPDAITLPLLWLGLLCKAVEWIPGLLSEAVLGAIAGYLLLLVLSEIYQWVKGIPALGMGDMKLMAAMGSWLGLPLLPYVLLAASAGGILFVLISRIGWQRELYQPFAFGPFISLAAISLFIHSII